MATVRENLLIFTQLQEKCALDGPQVMTEEDIKNVAMTAISLVPQLSEELLGFTKLIEDYEKGVLNILDLIAASGNNELYINALSAMIKVMLPPILGSIYEN